MPAGVGHPPWFTHMDDLHSRISSCSLDSPGLVNHYRQRLVANIQYRPKQLLMVRLLLAESGRTYVTRLHPSWVVTLMA